MGTLEQGATAPGQYVRSCDFFFFLPSENYFAFKLFFDTTSTVS